MKKTLLVSLPTLLALSLVGCATHTSESKKMRSHWNIGNTQSAQEEVVKLAENAPETDSLIWRLEEGTVARANGDLKRSEIAFDIAQKAIEKFENEPETRILQESEAILTNQSYIPYKGYGYDKIMLSVYQALNHIELKNFDAASVDLKRLEFYQNDIERLNAKKIADSQQALKEAQKKNSSASYDVNKTTNNPQVAAALRQVYGDNYKFDTSAREAKAIFVNPFAYWLSGLYFANRAIDTSDKNKASDMFRLGGEMLGNKSYVMAEDFKMAEDLANGKISKPAPTTYVIFETGNAPIREQFKLNLPIYIVARNVPHISVNFPYLSKQKSFTQDITIKADSKLQKLDTLADMDSIISEQFYNDLPIVIAKTIISSAIKAGTEYAVARAAGDGWEGVAVNIASSLYQSIMNDADLRTWTTLPKQIKVARFATPKNGKVNINGKELTVSPNQVNVILAKKMNADGKLILRIFDFSDSPKNTEK